MGRAAPRRNPPSRTHRPSEQLGGCSTVAPAVPLPTHAAPIAHDALRPHLRTRRAGSGPRRASPLFPPARLCQTRTPNPPPLPQPRDPGGSGAATPAPTGELTATGAGIQQQHPKYRRRSCAGRRVNGSAGEQGEMRRVPFRTALNVPSRPPWGRGRGSSGTPGEGRDPVVRVGAAGESGHRGLSHCHRARKAWERRLRERVGVWCSPLPAEWAPSCAQRLPGMDPNPTAWGKGAPRTPPATGSPMAPSHPVPAHSPGTDWHRHSRWDPRPLRIN